MQEAGFHITSSKVSFSHFEAKIKKTDICVAKDFVDRFLVHDIVNSFTVNRFFYETMCNFMTLFDIQDVFSICSNILC